MIAPQMIRAFREEMEKRAGIPGDLAESAWKHRTGLAIALAGGVTYKLGKKSYEDFRLGRAIRKQQGFV